VWPRIPLWVATAVPRNQPRQAGRFVDPEVVEPACAVLASLQAGMVDTHRTNAPVIAHVVSGCLWPQEGKAHHKAEKTDKNGNRVVHALSQRFAQECLRVPLLPPPCFVSPHLGAELFRAQTLLCRASRFGAVGVQARGAEQTSKKARRNWAYSKGRINVSGTMGRCCGCAAV